MKQEIKKAVEEKFRKELDVLWKNFNKLREEVAILQRGE
jgi:hypothetical protein